MRNAEIIDNGMRHGNNIGASAPHTASRIGVCSARHLSQLASLSSLFSFRTPLFVFLAVLLLSSCGAESGRFRIEGRFRNLNQGEFYVYSPDGGITGRDTVKVADGRFSYEVPLSDKATFILVFPNFSEQAVFGESGAVAKVSGDASHMREMEITGTDDNELMTKFRISLNRLSPPEVKGAVAEFVKEHPASPVSMFLVRRYLVQTEEPDYKTAHTLVRTMLRATPDNGRLAMFGKQLDWLSASSVGNVIPHFSAVDTEGRSVSRGRLNGRVNVVSVWASWSYDSQNMQRRLHALGRKYGSDLAVVSVCVDARVSDCRRSMTADSITWPNVCDGKMWDTPLLRKLGLATVPGNLVADSRGRIVARNLNARQLNEKLESLLKK